MQTIGRAARDVDGRVLLYSDQVTGSLKNSIDITRARRERQLAYNAKHGITPTTIQKEIKDITEQMRTKHEETISELLTVDGPLYSKNPRKTIKEKRRQMGEAVKILDFETAALIRDEILALESLKKRR